MSDEHNTTKPTPAELKRFRDQANLLYCVKICIGKEPSRAEDEAIVEAGNSVFGGGTGTPPPGGDPD